MKTFRQYIAGIACLAALTATFSACQDENFAPSMNVPMATSLPNTTILELKQQFWDDADNYAKVIADPDDPEHRYVIHGRVISSDEEGNVFKSLVIQDETAALAFSIDSYNLYLSYRVGQEIVMDVTGMEIGKYAGLEQIGRKSWYADRSTWQVSFMSSEYFKDYAQLNGLPEPAKIDTIEVNSFAEIASTAEGLQKWQSQLVRFRNVHFPDGGKLKFSVYHTKENTEQNRTLEDSNGASMTVRTSGYSTFWNETLPVGNIDLVGILGYHTNGGWQILMLDAEGVINVGDRPGTKEKPYTVEQAIEDQKNGIQGQGWVKGYIVGAVMPETDEVKSNLDIQWEAPAIVNNTLVIAPEPTTDDYTKCLVIQLPMGSALQTYGNLRDNASNLGKEIMITGSLASVYGTYGIADVTGKADSFTIEGVTVPGGEVPDGDGTAASPYNARQAKEIATALAADATTETDVYVKGTVSAVSIDTSYGNATYTITSGNGSLSVYRGYGLNGDRFTSTDQLKVDDEVVVCGKLINYKGNTPQMNQRSKIVSINGSGDTPVTPPTGDGDGTEAKPYSVDQVIAKNPADKDNALESGVWTKGYIVGYLPSGAGVSMSKVVFGTDGAVETNIVLGPTADCKDPALCIPVGLSSSVRPSLSLGSRPGNLGKQVEVFGDIIKYFGAPGVKNVSKFNIDGSEPAPSETPTGDGTEASPYNAAKAIQVTSALAADATTDYEVYVKGKVYSFTFNATYKNATYYIGDNANGQLFQIYAGKYLDGADFTSDIKLAIGSEVVVRGKLVNFRGNTPEMALGSTLISYTPNGGGGDDPNPPVNPPAGDGINIAATALTNLPGATTVSGVTVDVQKNNGTTPPQIHAGTSALRAYAKNSITISADKKIESIVFNLASDNKFRYAPVTVNTGAITPAQAAGDTTMTWKGDATSVTFTVGDKATLGSDGEAKAGQLRISSIDVILAK